MRRFFAICTPSWAELKRNQRGSALAEAAIVLPVILLLIFAMIYFGMLIYTHVVVELSAAQGARVAAAAFADDPDGLQTPSPEEKARGFVRSVLQAGLDLTDLEAIGIANEDIEGEKAVRVTVAYRFKLAVPFMSEWGASETARTSGVRVVRSSVYRIEVVGP